LKKRDEKIIGLGDYDERRVGQNYGWPLVYGHDDWQPQHLLRRYIFFRWHQGRVRKKTRLREPVR
jgi:hypothetical protein